MALPLGKLTILLGAGLVGSILSQEGRASKVSDFLTGAFKIVFKHIQQDGSQASSKPQSDSLLLAQVNSLKRELELLGSSGSVTIINSGSGSSSFGTPVVIIVGGVVGYGYIWWKGWKLSDMMFATRRSLSDACTSVGKQLEQVSTSISAAKRHLSSRIDNVDRNLDQCAEINSATRNEVSELKGDLREYGMDVESVQRAVQTLEAKIGRIEGKQDITNQGVFRLVEFVAVLEEKPKLKEIQGSPSSYTRPPLENSKAPSTLRTLSLPPAHLTLEPPSPSSGETPKVARNLQPAGLASGLKDLQEISNTTEVAGASSADSIAEEPSSSGSSSTSFGGWKMSSVPFFSRTCSATYTFK